VPAGEGGLRQASKVPLDQVRSIDKHRLGRRIGALPPERMLEVDRAIRLSFSV
jgi:mRNA-degrading endonuclease toxin of MazEF toxin-antitoxin module